MKKTPFSLFLFVSLCLLFNSCDENQFSEEEIQPTEPDQFPLVDEELKPYFQRFIDEGVKLGVEIDPAIENISGQIAEIREKNVLGQCSYGYHDQHNITIDLTFWNNSTDLYKELVVFHELGHCYLGRDHLETTFNNGICVSIMRSGTGFCYDYYRRDTRDYYIHELFFPDDKAPEILL